jgi:hypothetical protein
MSVTFTALPEAEGVRLRHFLMDVCKHTEDVPSLSPAQMHWKYWEPYPGWDGSRSYAYLDPSGEIVAHAATWPFGLLTPETTLAGVHPIDWAAGMKVPGAGALLLREIRKLRDISCCIGGTEIARKLIQQTGFKPVASMRLLARPLRPVRQALTHQHRNWKLPARLVRNTFRMITAAAAPAGWTTEKVQPSALPVGLLPAPAPGFAVARRSPELFGYLMKCPTARYELWLVRQGQEPRGYFLLSFVPGQARIADAWMAGGRESWRCLYALASQAALHDKSVAEIAVAVTLEEAFTAATACGFRRYDELAVMLFDPRKHLLGIDKFHLQMIESDMSFLHGKSIEYVT